MTHYAWATITGKVYVSDWELNEKLADKYPDAESPLEVCTSEEQQEAFKEIASEKLMMLCETDEPFKLVDTSVDMTSYTY